MGNASAVRSPSSRLPALFEGPFAEIAPPLTPAELLAESSRCLYCYDAPCTRACPTGIDVPSFIQKLATGNRRGAARVILEANILGASCARVCPTEVLCEGACVHNLDQRRPIPIGRLQRTATDWALEREWLPYGPGAVTGRRIAVVGAGPAGLACAAELRRLGDAVVIYDARERPGGLNSHGIAEYKMTAELAFREVELVRSLDVELRMKARVGIDPTYEALLSAYDALFLGLGLPRASRLGIPGEALPGVREALEFIEKLKLHPPSELRVGRRVAVLGGGNTAVDAATQAKRLGAERVVMIYRRGPADLSAYPYEIELLRRDGCELLLQTAPVRIEGQGKVERLVCQRREPDGAGGWRPGAEFSIEVDEILVAIGQRVDDGPLAAIPGLAFTDGPKALHTPTDGTASRRAKAKGRGIQTDATHRTGHPRVWAAGDCANGGAEVVNAVADGRDAARAIHAALATS